MNIAGEIPFAARYYLALYDGATKTIRLYVNFITSGSLS